MNDQNTFRACSGTTFIVWTCVFCCEKCGIIFWNWNEDWNNLCWSLCHAYCIDYNCHIQPSIWLWCTKTADHPHNQVNPCPLNNTSSSSIWNLFTPHTLSHVRPFWPPVGLRAHLRSSRPNQIRAWIEEGDILTADCQTALDGIDRFQEHQARRTSCNLFVYMGNRPHNTACWRALSMFQWYHFSVRFLLFCLPLISVSVGTSKIYYLPCLVCHSTQNSFSFQPGSWSPQRSEKIPSFGCISTMWSALLMAATSPSHPRHTCVVSSTTGKGSFPRMHSSLVTSTSTLRIHSLDGRDLQWTHACMTMWSQLICTSP